LTSEKFSIAQSPAGTWKGTSLCQIKNSSCRDEQVIYHILNDKGSDSYQIDAGKIIDGREIDMGTLHFNFDPRQQILFLNENLSR